MSDEVTEIRKTALLSLRVFWVVLWRFLLGAFLMGGVVYALDSGVQLPRATTQQVMDFMTLLFIPLLWWCVHAALNRNYGRFRVSLQPVESGEDAQTEAKTQKQK